MWRRPIRPALGGRVSITRLPEPHRASALGYGLPLDLPWEDFWRADYVGPSWPGLILARDLYDAIDYPATGPTQNGYTPANFNGTNVLYADGVAEDYLGTTEWTVHAVFKAASLAAPATFPADDRALLSVGPSTCAVQISLNTSGVAAVQYDGVGGYSVTPSASIGTTDYHVVQARWTGATLEIRVDGGAWQSVALASQVAYSGTGETLRVGVNYDGTKFFDGDLLEIGVASVAFSDTQLDELYAHDVARYALGAGGTASVAMGAMAVTPSWPLPTVRPRASVALGTLAPAPSWPSPTVLGRVVIAPSPLAVTPSWPSPTLTARAAVALSPLAVTPSWPAPTVRSRMAVALSPLTPVPSWPAPTLASRNAVALAALLVVPSWPLPTLAVPAVPIRGPYLRGRVATVAELAGGSTTPRRLRGRSPLPVTLAAHAMQPAALRGHVSRGTPS